MTTWRKKKPFPCLICGKDFDKESQLKKHLKDKHNLDLKEYKETYLNKG